MRNQDKTYTELEPEILKALNAGVGRDDAGGPMGDIKLMKGIFRLPFVQQRNQKKSEKFYAVGLVEEHTGRLYLYPLSKLIKWDDWERPND